MKVFPNCPFSASRKLPVSTAIVVFWGAFAGAMWSLGFDRDHPADLWTVILLAEIGVAAAWLLWTVSSSVLSGWFSLEYTRVMKVLAPSYLGMFFSSIAAVNLVFQTRTINALAFIVTAMMFVLFSIAAILRLVLEKRKIRFGTTVAIMFALGSLALVIHIGWKSFVPDVEYWRDGEEYSLPNDEASLYESGGRSYFNSHGTWRSARKIEGSTVLRSKMTISEPSDVGIAVASQDHSTKILRAAIYRDGAKVGDDRIETGDGWREKSWPIASGEVELRLSAENGVVFATEPSITRRSNRPDIYLIVIDTLRADHLSCYGYPRKTTRNIDGYATLGTLFEKNFSVSSWSTGAVASIMTGLYPTQHGCVDIKGLFLPLELQTFAEVLRQNGYKTIGVSGNPLLSLKLGFAQGFDVFDEKCFDDIYWRSGECMTDRGLALTDGDRPKLVFMQYFDPHAPQIAPPPFLGMFRGWPFKFDFGRAMRFLTNRYDEKILYGDGQIGRLLEGLAKRGALDNAYVIITADHGEELGERGHVAHGFTVYNEVTHTPLIIVGPGMTPGKRVTNLASSVDLFQTILAMAGLPPQKNAQGVNLLEPDSIVREFVFADNIEQTAIRSSKWKFLANSSARREELYDVVNDPAELHDVAAKHPDVRAEYHDKLDAFLGKISAIKAPSRHGQELSEQVRGRLKALGYTQ